MDGCLIFQGGCLRVNVVEGAELSKTLRSGQMNFLTAVEEIQKALHQHKAIEAQSATLVGSYFDFFSTPDQFTRINCFDPWLFTRALGTREDQQAYYRKVWQLLRHVSHHLVLIKLGLSVLLMRVIPQFPTLQVTIVVRGGDGWEESLTLDQGDEEGSIFALSRIQDSSFLNRDNTSTHPSDQRISGESSPRPHFPKVSNLSRTHH